MTRSSTPPVGVGRISGGTVWWSGVAVGAGPALLCFPGGGEEVAVAGPRMVGVVVPGVPGAAGVGGTVCTAGTLGPAQHCLQNVQSLNIEAGPAVYADGEGVPLHRAMFLS